VKNLHFTIPTIITVVAVALLLRGVGLDTTFIDKGYSVPSAPTPYSDAHAVVQTRPGSAEEQPPTF
jgi:hypothetical protein